MKNFRLTILMSIMSTIVMAFTTLRNKVIEVPVIIEPSRPLALSKITPKADIVKIKKFDHEAYLEALGNFESGNSYTKVNRFGYMGRYQFGKATLKAVDINVSRKTFLNDPDLQEEAMQRLMLSNYKTLKRYIKKYEGKVHHGVLVTKSGILAAAHLGGAGNVRRWFRNGKNFADGNGTKITSYMKIFQGYQLDI